MNKIKTLASIAKAASDLENTKEDGTINWDYVSADVYLDMMPHIKEERELIDTMLGQFADGYEYKTTVGVRPNYS